MNGPKQVLLLDPGKWVLSRDGSCGENGVVVAVEVDWVSNRVTGAVWVHQEHLDHLVQWSMKNMEASTATWLLRWVAHRPLFCVRTLTEGFFSKVWLFRKERPRVVRHFFKGHLYHIKAGSLLLVREQEVESVISRPWMLKRLLRAKICNGHLRLLLRQGKGGIRIEMETRHAEPTGIVGHSRLVDRGIFILDEGQGGKTGAVSP